MNNIYVERDHIDGNIINIRADQETELPLIQLKRTDSARIALNVVDENAIDVYGVTGGGEKKIEKTVIPAWSTENDIFTVTLDGKTIDLPIAGEPGALTPSGEPEIIGQDALVYDIAVALKTGRNCLLTGPSGVGKTSILKWLAQKLNYNYVVMQVTRGTQDVHMIGEYLPVDRAKFSWVDGPVTRAVRASQSHPTILVFDEMNRIGNVAEFARIYSLLDDNRTLSLPEKHTASKEVETVKADDLFIFGTSNPVDSGDEASAVDYIGVQELDPALTSRFHLHPVVGYPQPDAEADALMSRVPSVSITDATKIVHIANKIRDAVNVRFAVTFRDMMALAETLQFFGGDIEKAAGMSIIQKAHPTYRADILSLIKLAINDAPTRSGYEFGVA